MSIASAIGDHVARVIAAQREQVELDLAEAITLQDFDMLDRLCVVYVDGWPSPPPAVASMLSG